MGELACKHCGSGSYVRNGVVYKWVRAAGEEAPTPSAAPSSGIVQIDEMWHFVDGKKQGLAVAGL
jgi:hypothetical protein